LLELPEIAVISRQLESSVVGKTIRRVVVLCSPHKFAFLNRTADDYPALLAGRRIERVQSRGNYAVMKLDSGLSLVLGDMGGRLLYHASGGTLPQKHQLLVQFEDETSLTLTLQMWGAILLLDPDQLASHSRIKYMLPDPLGSDFTFEYFQRRIESALTIEKPSLKYFIISQFGLPGVGNGCTHDILFNARMHPKFPLSELSPEDQRTLWQVARNTLQRMAEAGGRSSERDLFDVPGGYVPVLSNEKVGTPCPVCGTPIERITYLGGASFFCPKDQPL